jgi:DNA-binding transcriptional ArsR family regulator
MPLDEAAPTSNGDGLPDRVPIDRHYGPVTEVFAALASPLRAAIVHRLTVRDHTVANLVEALGASQPLVSQHLGRLRNAGLVEGERHGRQIVYRIADQHVAHIFLDAYEHSAEKS